MVISKRPDGEWEARGQMRVFKVALARGTEMINVVQRGESAEYAFEAWVDEARRIFKERMKRV